MQLTNEQLKPAETGQAVELTADGQEFVLLSRDVYDRVRRVVSDDAPGPLTTARIIRAATAEDDADDPTLESYQRCRTTETTPG